VDSQERIPDIQISDYANLNNHYCPILNKVRASLQNKQLYVYCATAGTPMVIYYPIVKKPHRRGQTTDFSPKELYDFRSFSDDKKSRLPFNGHLAIGMPVMITQNMFPKIKVMNGTIGFIVSIQHDVENLMTITYGTEANNYIQTHECSRSPKVVFIKLYNREEEYGYGPGAIPIPLENLSGKITLSNNRSQSFKIEQFAFVNAFSLTIDKCQGLTLNSVIMGPIKHSSRNTPHRHSLYVLLSRGRTLSRIRFMEELTLSHTEYFKPAATTIALIAHLNTND
jgi:hypothetical protein